MKVGLVTTLPVLLGSFHTAVIFYFVWVLLLFLCRYFRTILKQLSPEA